MRQTFNRTEKLRQTFNDFFLLSQWLFEIGKKKIISKRTVNNIFYIQNIKKMFLVKNVKLFLKPGYRFFFYKKY